MKTRKKFFIPSAIALAVILLSFLFFSFALAAIPEESPLTINGIVPCGKRIGGLGESDPCTLCHLIVGLNRVYKYLVYLSVTVSLVAIFFAGVMYIVSTGSEKVMTAAKSFLKSALIGFSVIVCSWLIVNVVIDRVMKANTDFELKGKWYNFDLNCSTKSDEADVPDCPGICRDKNCYYNNEIQIWEKTDCTIRDKICCQPLAPAGLNQSCGEDAICLPESECTGDDVRSINGNCITGLVCCVSATPLPSKRCVEDLGGTCKTICENGIINVKNDCTEHKMCCKAESVATQCGENNEGICSPLLCPDTPIEDVTNVCGGLFCCKE